MDKRIIITLFLLLFSLDCLATAQTPDTIVINDKKYHLLTNPLTSYLKKIDWEPPPQVAIWSSNWRGYLAKWEIEAGHLVLSDATIEIKLGGRERKRQSILKTIFSENKQIIAKWYSGALIVPDGEKVNSVNMGYGTTYENYQILHVKNGVIVEHLKMSNNEFTKYKDKKFQAFRETDKFKKEFNNLTNGEYNWSKEEAIGFIQSYYAEHYLSL